MLYPTKNFFTTKQSLIGLMYEMARDTVPRVLLLQRRGWLWWRRRGGGKSAWMVEEVVCRPSTRGPRKGFSDSFVFLWSWPAWLGQGEARN